MSITVEKKALLKEALSSASKDGRAFFEFDKFPEYLKDATEISHTPDALLFAQSEDELIDVVRFCRAHDIPLILRGAGTGYSGGALAVTGGLLVSIERMNQIVINANSKTATVGPGAITGDIFDAAEKENLFYPPDPASYRESTIAGNLAENAGGLRCKKYGVTKDYAISCRGIDAAGKLQSFDCHSPFGLLDLMIGSEGTLFIFTEIKLRLIELPPSGTTIIAVFNKTIDAAAVVAEVIESGIIPSIMEFMDGDAINCSNQFDPDNAIDEGAALLLFETDSSGSDSSGSDSSGADSSGADSSGADSSGADSSEENRPDSSIEANQIMAICKKHNPTHLRLAKDDKERDQLWSARRNLSNAIKQAGGGKLSEDVCVLPSRLPELVSFVEELAASSKLRINCFGHAGDGNLHVNFLGGANKEDLIKATVKKLFSKTLELGGTLTGEHGIGITKKDFIDQEFDSATLTFMRRLKHCLDPDNYLNPGKIFPTLS